jgi:hypothetical protein
LGLATLAYGDIASAFEGMKGKTWERSVIGASSLSIFASYIGGFVGPILIGASAGRVRRPVLLSSIFGAAFAALIGAVAALPAEWICERYAPRSMLRMDVILVLSLLVGLLGGWLGGGVVLRRRLSPGETCVI